MHRVRCAPRTTCISGLEVAWNHQTSQRNKFRPGHMSRRSRSAEPRGGRHSRGHERSGSRSHGNGGGKIRGGSRRRHKEKQAAAEEIRIVPSSPPAAVAHLARRQPSAGLSGRCLRPRGQTICLGEVSTFLCLHQDSIGSRFPVAL